MDNNISVKLISLEDIKKTRSFNLKKIIEIIENSLIAYSKGEILLPDKISQIFDYKLQTRINCMPSTLLKEGICGVKWVSVFPNNPVLFDRQNVSGVILLSEIKTGFPFAIVDGTLITALRTACLGAIGAKYLARKDSTVYGTIGTGEQAKTHFLLIKTLFPKIKTCYVASRTSKSEEAFIQVMKKKFEDVTFIACNSDYDLAAKNADIIVTAVSCQEPLLKAKSIKKGAFYCHVGGWEDEYSVPLRADKIVCDDWASLKHRGSPTIARMYEEEILMDEDIYANLADIISGKLPGRESDLEFIYFNSIGLSFVDVSVAYYIYQEVISKGFGKDWTIQNADTFEVLEDLDF